MLYIGIGKNNSPPFSRRVFMLASICRIRVILTFGSPLTACGVTCGHGVDGRILGESRFLATAGAGRQRPNKARS
jgi:hypothetical protein